MRPFIIMITAFFFLLAFTLYTLSQTSHNHDLYHAQYNDWKSITGFSCCNNQDCGTLPESRVREVVGKTEVLVLDIIRGDKWCPVEAKHLIDQTRGKRRSPDGTVDHACIVASADTDPCERLKCFMEKAKF